MALLWIYRKFVESSLNVPTFSADKDKCNGSYYGPKFDDTNSLELSKDHPSRLKKSPAFQKKRVFYFSPNYFSKNGPSTVDSVYKFYLKSSNENFSRYKADSKYHYISKTDEDERSTTTCQNGKCNIMETLSPEKYEPNPIDSEKQLKNGVAKQPCASTLFSQVLDISNYYFIYPFYVTKMIFDSHNVGYYYVNYQDTSDLNVKSPDADIYSVDDLTFENFCLQEVEESIKESPCNMLLKSSECETDDLQSNGNFDQKHDFLTSELYKPYYTLKSETAENMSTTSGLFETKYVCSEFHGCFDDQSSKYIQAYKANDSDITANDEKFKSTVQLDKYDFSLAKLFRKLMNMKRMEPEDN